MSAYGASGPTRPEQFLDLSWEMFGELCRALALRVARDYEPEVVVGIARAGVIPGAVIASILPRRIARRSLQGRRCLLLAVRGQG